VQRLGLIGACVLFEWFGGFGFIGRNGLVITGGVPTLEFADGNGVLDREAFDSGLDERRATRAQTSGAKYF